MKVDPSTRVVMSKTIARSYLEQVGTVHSTLTIYSYDEPMLRSFTSSVLSKYGESVDASFGFDHVTFVTQDLELAEVISRRADAEGYVVSGF